MSEDYTTRAILTANVGNWVAGFKTAGEAYKSFERNMRNGISSTDAVERSSSVVSKAMKASAVAVAGLGVASIKTGMDFEHQMSRVGSIAGASGADLKKLNDQAIKLGADTAFSAKEAAAGMENLASAGMNSKQIMAAMPGVLNLAAVSGGNVGEAAENAAVALNGFGLQASDSAHVADVFARAAADTNAEASDMGEALKMVAPQAKTAGMSLEETAAAIGILSNAGIKGSMAGSNLGMALTKLQNPSAEAAGLMADLGFNAYDTQGKMKPLNQIVTELQGILKSFPDKAQQYDLSTIFGVQGGRAMQVLLHANNNELGDLTNKLKNSDGSAQEMATTMQNDLASSVEQFGGALESLSIVLEETFSSDLKGAVDGAAEPIQKLTKYIQDNQLQLQADANKAIELAQSFGKLLPSVNQMGSVLKIILPSLVAIETFKGIGAGGAKTIKALETMQADLSLVNTGFNMTKAGLLNMTTIGGVNVTNLGSKVKGLGTSAKTAGSTMKLALESPLDVFKLMGDRAKSAGEIVTTSFVHPKEAISDLAVKVTTVTKTSRSSLDLLGKSSDNLNAKFFNLLKSFGASDSQLSSLTNTAVLNGEALGKVGRGATLTKEQLAQGAIAAGGFGSSLGALSVVAAGVALVATSMTYAWKTNFMNIQGVVKTAVDGIKGMFESLQKPIGSVKTALEPIMPILKLLAKTVGALAIGALVVSIIAVATAIRVTVDALVALVNVAAAAVQGIKALFQAMKGNFDGAKKSVDGAKKSLGQAGDSVKDMGSAFIDAGKVGYDSFSQLGKSSDGFGNKVKAASVSTKAMSKSMSNMRKDFEKSKMKLSDLINTDGVSDKTKQFLNSVKSMLDKYQTETEASSDDYKKAMVKAEKLTGQERLKAINEANQKLASATQTHGKDLLAINQDLDRQLQARRFTDGTAMNQQQFEMLTKQNEMVKQKLLEQNQIYVQAQMSRLQNGDKLNKQERAATITTIQSNYQVQADQIQQGEQRITDLKNQIKQAQDVTTKAKLQQELVTAQNHQTKLIQQQQNFGTQMNQTIANGSNLNYQTWFNGLQKMNDITAPQLQSMFLSFVKMNNDTGQQMQAFAYMLKQSGVQGVTGLVTALQDGRFSAKEASTVMNQSTIQGLETLPDSMFKNGDKGQKSFIKALKAGKFKDAGKYLADQSSSGAKDTKKHGKSGKDNADEYSKKVEQQKNKAKSSGKQIAKASADGEKSQKKAHGDAGKSNGEEYSNGVKSKNKSAQSAGKGLAQNTQSGANGVSFNPVGQNMANGVAQGINNNTPNAVNAMRNLVNKVNLEAKKTAKIHSPSRLLRDEVGKYLALGVSVGIDENADTASKSMGDLISQVANTGKDMPLNMDIMQTLVTDKPAITSTDSKIGSGNSSTNSNIAITPKQAPKPLYLSLNLGNSSFKEFVEDITNTQNVQIDLNHKYRLGG